MTPTPEQLEAARASLEADGFRSNMRTWPDVVTERALRLAAEAERAEMWSRLPDGMQGCTINLRQCEFGHAWLTATNWLDHGCPTCELKAARANADLGIDPAPDGETLVVTFGGVVRMLLGHGLRIDDVDGVPRVQSIERVDTEEVDRPAAPQAEAAEPAGEPPCMYCDGKAMTHGPSECHACRGTGVECHAHALLGELRAVANQWEGGLDEDPVTALRSIVSRFCPEPDPPSEVERLRVVLVAVRDDAYVLGEECDEGDHNVGRVPECPTCVLALRIDAALADAGAPAGGDPAARSAVVALAWRIREVLNSDGLGVEHPRARIESIIESIIAGGD